MREALAQMERVTGLLTQGPRKESPHFVRFDAISGEGMEQMCSAILILARAFPKAERRLLTNFPIHAKAPAAAAVLGDSGLVHGYMRYTMATRRIGELLSLAWKIRRFSPDILVYLMSVRPLKNIQRDRLFFRLAGVQRIVGLPGEEELKSRFDPVTGLYESEASRLARAIVEIGDAHPEDIANWDLCLNADEKEAATTALSGLSGKKLITCCPGTKMQSKDWEQENWRVLLGHLYLKYPSYGLVMVGEEPVLPLHRCPA